MSSPCCSSGRPELCQRRKKFVKTWLLDYMKAQTGPGREEAFSFRLQSQRRKKTQLHLPGHLKTSSSSAPAHYMAAWEHVAVCQAAGRGCSSQATAELPRASGGIRPRRVCVCVCEGDEVSCVLLIDSLAGPSNMLSQIVCAQQELAWRDFNQWFNKSCVCVQELKQSIAKYLSIYVCVMYVLNISCILECVHTHACSHAWAPLLTWLHICSEQAKLHFMTQT